MLIIANALVRSALKHQPKRFHIKEFINPLKEPRFILVSLACFMTFLAVFLPGTFIVLDSISKGMSNGLAFYLIPILNAVR